METISLITLFLFVLVGLMLTELLAAACEIKVTWMAFIMAVIFWTSLFLTVFQGVTPLAVAVLASFFAHLFYLMPTHVPGMNHGELPPNWYK